MNESKRRAPLVKACRECPFRRASFAGYLGEASHEPEQFIESHWHGFDSLPCHMRIDWTRPRTKIESQIATAPTCFGYATLCKNTAKVPLNPTDAEAVKNVDKNQDIFFSNLGEFIRHHK